MNTYKVKGHSMYASNSDSSERVFEKETEAQVLKSCEQLGIIVESIQLIKSDIATKKENGVSEIFDAEAILYEMDANNCDQITTKEGFGETITYTREMVEKQLLLRSN